MLSNEAVDSYTSVFYEEVSKTAGKNNDKQSIKLIVPEDTEELNKYSSIENTQNQSARFMELSSVKGVVQNTTLYNQINTIVTSLNKIMLVLIVLAVLFAIVILYNLTNINVAERIRELCTIKVLGFYDKETTMYIYRETIIICFKILCKW